MFSSLGFYIPLAQAQQPVGFVEALFQMLPIMLLIFFVYYFLYQRPVQKEQDAHTKMLMGLIVGDSVITIGGIRGEITAIQEDALVLKTGNKSSITVLKTSIRRKEKGDT